MNLKSTVTIPITQGLRVDFQVCSVGSWLLRIGGGGGSGDRDTTAAVDVAGAIASHRIIGILDVLRHLIG